LYDRILIATLVIFVLGAFQEMPDQLEPGEYGTPDVLPDYHRMVEAVLKEGYAEDVQLRMLVIPSFEPEWMVGVRARGQAFELIVLRPERQLWQHGMRNVRVERCINPIDSGLAAKLAQAWKIALEQPRPPPAPSAAERITLDGTSFHFWLRGEPVLAGHVQSPQPQWRSGRLAELGAKMRAYCAKPSAAGAEGLRQSASNLR
jgi:hypothetical protein